MQQDFVKVSCLIYFLNIMPTCFKFDLQFLPSFPPSHTSFLPPYSLLTHSVSHSLTHSLPHFLPLSGSSQNPLSSSLTYSAFIPWIGQFSRISGVIPKTDILKGLSQKDRLWTKRTDEEFDEDRIFFFTIRMFFPIINSLKEKTLQWHAML